MSDKTVLYVELEDTMEVLGFIIAVGKGIEQSVGDDGAITLRDFPNFLPAIVKLGPALSGIANVPAEIKLINPDDMDKLKAYVKDELDLEDDKVERLIEDAFGVVLDLWYVVNNYFLSGGEPEPDEKTEAPA